MVCDMDMDLPHVVFLKVEFLRHLRCSGTHFSPKKDGYSP